MSNRIIFLGIFVGIIISTIFTVKLSVSTSNDFFTQFLLGGMGFILQIGSYSTLGMGLNLLEKKNSVSKKVFGVICLFMTIILFGINVLGSSGLIYETSRTTFIENSLTSKEYRYTEDDYNRYKELETNEIKSKEKLQNELDKLNIKYSSEIKNIQENRKKEYDIKIKAIENNYDIKIRQKEQQYLITSEGGAEDLKKLKNNEIDNIKKEMNNKIGEDIKEISINIGNLEKEIEKKEKNIKEYKKNKTENGNKMEGLKNTGNLNNKNGYSLILIKLFGAVGETVSIYFFIILSILFELLILILCQVLFIFKKYNPVLDFKYNVWKKKTIDFKKEKIYNEEKHTNEEDLNLRDSNFLLDEYLSTKELTHNMKLKDICNDISNRYNIDFSSKELGKKLKEKGIEKTGIKNGYPVFTIGV